jgi:small subunit ribosomal protein S6e
MVFKINVANKGKTYKVETENEELAGHSIGEKINGSLINADLTGYELEITGTSDKAGFCGVATISGPGLKKVLLGYGHGMHKRPKGLSKKPGKKPNGLKLRKTVRGKEISPETVQINTKVTKEGSKKFADLLPKKEEPNTEAPKAE